MADNYLIQAAQAKVCFLRYDQDKLIEKLHLAADDQYLYTAMFSTPYRIHRKTGDIDRLEGETWVDVGTHSEVMTLLDLVCDSKQERFLSGKLKNMADFGLMFHQSLLEERDPWAQRFQDNLEGFRRACTALKGKPLPIGDAAYAIELFDGLCIGLQLWLGDEEFPPNLRFLWDENALMYIKYETMYYARGLLLQWLGAEMEAKNG